MTLIHSIDKITEWDHYIVLLKKVKCIKSIQCYIFLLNMYADIYPSWIFYRLMCPEIRPFLLWLSVLYGWRFNGSTWLNILPKKITLRLFPDTGSRDSTTAFICLWTLSHKVVAGQKPVTFWNKLPNLNRKS
jgi:hypothetical protein